VISPEEYSWHRCAAFHPYVAYAPTITCPRFFVSGYHQADTRYACALNFICFPLRFLSLGMIAGVSVPIKMDSKLDDS
jgi:hypothetical protein